MKEKLEHALRTCLTQLIQEGKMGRFDMSKVTLTRPTDGQFGDYTTNIGLMVSKEVAMKPRDIAELMVSSFSHPLIAKTEIAGPGHINFYLSETAYSEELKRILHEGGRYGNSMLGDGERVNNEFISANPTGPLHLGNGRGGFYGDTLARIMKKAGYDVINEYYVNDAGEQVVKLGHSVLKDSEAVYGGDYIEKLAERLNGETNVRLAGQKAAQIILEEMIKPVVNDVMRVHFDVWTSEKQLVTDGYIDKAIDILKEKKLTFEAEGAVWLRTTQFGDDKDRVLVKSDGSKTYFASDCGYLLNKMERGFTALIETWGADHHGYIGRFRAAAEALGFPKDKIHFAIVQLVRLMKDGQEVRMSKRAGNVVGIDELIETVGHDVARFFFLMYSADTHMNFDLGLAEERSEKNPVFYIQYAFARLSSILRKAKEGDLEPTTGNLALLTHPKEKLLIRELLAFPELIERMASEKTVHQLSQYAIRLADRLHSFYAECQVIDGEKKELSQARLALVRSVQIVLGETLRLLGVSAPEKM
ncbi:MAG: arginine--tRNA ligase [Candidatus Moraniibacteriota bacterium]|nr:MAG: arginine--tRNA ligase [Candidatus Moranbacteria bacterium]